MAHQVLPFLQCASVASVPPLPHARRSLLRPERRHAGPGRLTHHDEHQNPNIINIGGYSGSGPAEISAPVGSHAVAQISNTQNITGPSAAYGGRPRCIQPSGRSFHLPNPEIRPSNPSHASPCRGTIDHGLIEGQLRSRWCQKLAGWPGCFCQSHVQRSEWQIERFGNGDIQSIVTGDRMPEVPDALCERVKGKLF